MLGLFNNLKMDLKTEIESKAGYKSQLDESIKMYESTRNSLKEEEVEVKKLENHIDNLIENTEDLHAKYSQPVEV